ncbi:MAG TPA: CDGSH iron-sulfur domain-containing protein [Baekduia sp.]|nr:CDGSH iron-sulfur domain-containing protein [Baekduia sp.]
MRERPTQDTRVEIKVRDNGPYKVTGPVRLIDPDGGVFELPDGESIVLCRCGLSQDKPFCDRSHKGVFDSCERAPSAGQA